MEADAILEASLKDKHSNKSNYCDILSDSQMARRQRRETPFSDLSVKDKLKIGINVEVSENE